MARVRARGAEDRPPYNQRDPGRVSLRDPWSERCRATGQFVSTPLTGAANCLHAPNRGCDAPGPPQIGGKPGATRSDSGLAPLVGRSDREGEGGLRRPSLARARHRSEDRPLQEDTGLKTGHYGRAPTGSGPLHKLTAKQIPQA